ncbi:MAG: hypothetical protein V1754_11925, partial [Pseudomonadota bacterium]
MNEQVVPVLSDLPAAAFLAPFAAGVLVFCGKHLGHWLWQALTVLGSAATLFVGLVMASMVLERKVIICWNNELRVDAVSAIMVVLIGAISLAATIYSVRYVSHAAKLERAENHASNSKLWIYHWLILLFVATMVWGCVTNNLIMLFVAVEATTLTSGFLVAFFWDRRALEAAYKYLMLLTIGITVALFGCVLLYSGAAATGKLDGGNALLISEIKNVVSFVPTGTAILAASFLIIG